MDFDFFISHSSKDKHIADQVCAALERSGIRCWIAPRDIKPGDEYGAAIVHAIDRCRAMVLIFTSNANVSRQVPRELERGVSRGVPILPVRIEDVVPRDSLAYFVGSVQWFDAMNPPFENHLQSLADSASRLLRAEKAPGDPRPEQSARDVATPVAMPFDRTRSSSAPAVGRFAVVSLIVCVCLLLVALTVSQWFGKDVGLRVAEPTAEAPAKTSADAPAKPPPVQALQPASQPAEAPKAEVKTEIRADTKPDIKAPAVDEPVVGKPAATETTPAIGSVTAEAPSSEAPKDESAVAASKDAPSPEAAPQPSTEPPSSVSSFSIKDNPHFTVADAKRVEQVAGQKKFPLPKYQIAEIAPDVPAKLRRYVGIWVTKTGFNGGLGREGMLIVSDMDAQGTASGTYMLGPPNGTSYDQRPAFARPVSGKIKNGSLLIDLGSVTGTISFASSNTLSVKWVRKVGPTAVATFYPVWMLSEHEGAPSAAQKQKPK